MGSAIRSIPAFFWRFVGSALAVGEWRGVLAVVIVAALGSGASSGSRRPSCAVSSARPTPDTPTRVPALVPFVVVICGPQRAGFSPPCSRDDRDDDTARSRARRTPALTPNVLSMVKSSTRNKAPPQTRQAGAPGPPLRRRAPDHDDGDQGQKILIADVNIADTEEIAGQQSGVAPAQRSA